MRHVAEPAWPTLRGQLLLLIFVGAGLVTEQFSADDHADVIDSRIQDINQMASGGPLPWLPPIPLHTYPPVRVFRQQIQALGDSVQLA